MEYKISFKTYFQFLLGMTVESQKDWEAQANLLDMQTVLNVTKSKLHDAECEIQKLNKTISNEDQFSENMLLIEKLQDNERDLVQKLEKSKSDLELAQNGKIKFYHKMPVY